MNKKMIVGASGDQNSSNAQEGPARDEFNAHACDLHRAAQTRWLTVTETQFLLGQHQTLIEVRCRPPCGPPAPESGSLFLYDRIATRNYKADGHQWVRKRNSTKVREDHVKLKVKGVKCVAGCYVHCSNRTTMHRRAYHLLAEDTSAASAATGTTKSASFGSSNRVSNLVLVHYLDTECAAALLRADCAEEAPMETDAPPRRMEDPPRFETSTPQRAMQTQAPCCVGAQDATTARMEARMQLQPIEPQAEHKHDVGHGHYYLNRSLPRTPAHAQNQWPHEEPPPIFAARSFDSAGWGGSAAERLMPFFRVSSNDSSSSCYNGAGADAVQSGSNITQCQHRHNTMGIYPSPIKGGLYCHRSAAMAGINNTNISSMLGIGAVDDLWGQIMDDEANHLDFEITVAASSAIKQHSRHHSHSHNYSHRNNIGNISRVVVDNRAVASSRHYQGVAQEFIVPLQSVISRHHHHA
jgi:hypothetical protein